MLKNVSKLQKNSVQVSIRQHKHLQTAQLTISDASPACTRIIQTWTGYPEYVQRRCERLLDHLYEVDFISWSADPTRAARMKLKK